MAKRTKKALTKANVADVVANIDAATAYVAMNVSVLGVTRKGDKNTITTDDDKELLRLGFNYIDPKHLKPIHAATGPVRVWIRDRIALPHRLFKGSGVYRIPAAMADEINTRLEQAEAEFNAAADTFAEHYGEYLAEGRSRLKAHRGYVPRRVPSVEQVRDRFRCSFHFFRLGTADNLTEVIVAKEKAKAQARLEADVALIRDALRESFLRIVAHFADRLGTVEEGKRAGKRKSLDKGTLPGVLEFLDTFAKRNVVGDGELAALVDKARDIVKGVDTKSLKDDDNTRTAVRAGMATIEKELKGLGVVTRTRRIQLDDDEDAA